MRLLLEVVASISLTRVLTSAPARLASRDFNGLRTLLRELPGCTWGAPVAEPVVSTPFVFDVDLLDEAKSPLVLVRSEIFEFVIAAVEATRAETVAAILDAAVDCWFGTGGIETS